MNESPDLGRMYFSLQLPDSHWHPPYVRWIWISWGKTESSFSGRSYPMFSKSFGRRVLNTIMPMRIEILRGRKKMPDLLQSGFTFFFSEALIEGMTEAGLTFQCREVELVDGHGQPVSPAEREAIGKRYFYVPMPASPIKCAGSEGELNLHYHGADDLFSNPNGHDHYITFPVLDVVYKKKLTNFLTGYIPPMFPYPPGLHSGTISPYIKKRDELLKQFPFDLKARRKDWPGPFIEHALKLGYRL